jgi:hypothetical protein
VRAIRVYPLLYQILVVFLWIPIVRAININPILGKKSDFSVPSVFSLPFLALRKQRIQNAQ